MSSRPLYCAKRSIDCLIAPEPKRGRRRRRGGTGGGGREEEEEGSKYSARRVWTGVYVRDNRAARKESLKERLGEPRCTRDILERDGIHGGGLETHEKPRKGGIARGRRWKMKNAGVRIARGKSWKMKNAGIRRIAGRIGLSSPPLSPRESASDTQRSALRCAALRCAVSCSRCAPSIREDTQSH